MNENLDVSLKEFGTKKNFNNCMTSELIYIWRTYKEKNKNFSDIALEQFLKRLKYCGCTTEMAEEFAKREIYVFKNSDMKLTKIPTLNYPIEEGTLGICGYHWWDDNKPIFKDGIRNANAIDFTISEIVSLTDRAEYLVVYEHENENISEAVFNELYLLSETGKQKFLLQMLADQLITKHGWNMECVNKFFANEFAIIKKYRYGKAENPFGEE